MTIPTEAEAWNAFVKACDEKKPAADLIRAIAQYRCAQLEAARPARRHP